jgi:hypothetical protein
LTLERRYRDVLRWYPRRWRLKNEDAAVGTLLELAEGEGRGTPGGGELRSLRLSAMLYRTGVVGRWIPQPVRDRAAALSLGLGASMGVVGIVVNLIVPPRAEAVVAKVGGLGTFPHLFGPFGSDAVVLYGIWVAAGLLAMTGLHRSARVAIAVAIPTAVILGAISNGLQQLMPASFVTLALFELLALVVLFGSAGQDRTGRIAVLASFLGGAALTGVTAVTSFAPAFYSFGYTAEGFTQIDEYWLAFVGPFALLGAAILAQSRWRAWGGAIVLALLPIAVTYLCAGTDLFNAASFIAAIGLALVGAWALLHAFGVRLSVTRTS